MIPKLALHISVGVRDVAIAIAVSLTALELISRVCHGNAYPAIVQSIDLDEIPRLPIDTHLRLGLPDSRQIDFQTDHFGARIYNSKTVKDANIVVIGDSQALGWGLEFESTFAAQFAKSSGQSIDSVRLLAAPGVDPEHFTYLSAIAAKAYPNARVQVFVVNLGNDVDEIYTGPSNLNVQPTSGIKQWLGTHSFVYADTAIALSKLRPTPTQLPGLSLAILDTSSIEKVVLGEAIAHRVSEAASLGRYSRTICIIIPSDTQLYPAEFEKYKKYYKKVSQYNSAKAYVEKNGFGMNIVQASIKHELDRLDIPVLIASPPSSNKSAIGMYDRHYHHLTASEQTQLAVDLTSLEKTDDDHVR